MSSHALEIDTRPNKGRWCLRCGADRKEAAAGIRCRVYGITYRFHMWKLARR